MKKLVAAACCIFFLQNFSKFSDNNSDQKSSGKRTLVKAIAVIVNTEANKKLPAKKIFIASSEMPLGEGGRLKA